MDRIRSVEDATYLIENFNRPPETFEMALAESLTLENNPVSTEVALALISEAIETKGWAPNNFNFISDDRKFTYSPLDRQAATNDEPEALCPDCATPLFTVTAGITRAEEVQSFVSQSPAWRDDAQASSGAMPGGTFCRNGCIAIYTQEPTPVSSNITFNNDQPLYELHLENPGPRSGEVQRIIQARQKLRIADIEKNAHIEHTVVAVGVKSELESFRKLLDTMGATVSLHQLPDKTAELEQGPEQDETDAPLADDYAPTRSPWFVAVLAILVFILVFSMMTILL